VVSAGHRFIWLSVIAFGLSLGVGLAQQPDQSQPGQPAKNQDIPDAPSAVRPPQPFPSTPPATEPPTPASQSPGEQVPPNQPPPGSTAGDSGETAGTPPPFKVTTVPPGGSTQGQSRANEELYRIVVNTNQVIVPVMVKDDNDHLVSGLLSQDFSVYEDGKKQTLNFFTSDPLVLSAAVIIDLGMPDVAVQKVNKTFPALQGAFTQFDEVSVYTYSTNVGRMSGFAAAGSQLSAALNDLSTKHGDNNGPPVTGGPLGPQGPTVNNIPVGSPTSPVTTPAKTAHVLNDAILAAAMDLSKRQKSRRKVIFIVSDGREYRSEASYQDVLKVLLSNGIMVYGVGVEGAAIPLYNKIERLHLPKFGYSDILPKYANATGGEIFNEFTRSSIEDVYEHVIGDARNQYTLGYQTRATPSTSYRQIEVRVANHGPSCRTSMRPCVDVTAKDGYYPLPVAR
jgi:VWFA-related protein